MASTYLLLLGATSAANIVADVCRRSGDIFKPHEDREEEEEDIFKPPEGDEDREEEEEEGSDFREGDAGVTLATLASLAAAGKSPDGKESLKRGELAGESLVDGTAVLLYWLVVVPRNCREALSILDGGSALRDSFIIFDSGSGLDTAAGGGGGAAACGEVEEEEEEEEEDDDDDDEEEVPPQDSSPSLSLLRLPISGLIKTPTATPSGKRRSSLLLPVVSLVVATGRAIGLNCRPRSPLRERTQSQRAREIQADASSGGSQKLFSSVNQLV